jgi:hypothetical protein
MANKAPPYAPIALNAACASDAWPAKPVTITSPSAMIAVEAINPTWNTRYSEANSGHTRSSARIPNHHA